MKQENIPSCVRRTAIIVSVLIIINTLWLSIAYRHELFLMSLQFIIDYQSSGNMFTQTVYNLISLISGTEFSIAFVFLVILLPFRKANSFILVMYVTVNIYIMSILKIAFIDPRPAWYTNVIKQLSWKCEYSYGFPSGHCWIILILHEAIITDIIGTGPYYLFLTQPVLMLVLVPLSRMYLGEHSGDQVLDSLVYSFALAVIYKFKLQKLMFRLFAYLINCKHKARAFFVILLLQILILVPPLVIYEVNTSQNRLGDFYLSRINTICSENYSLQEIQGKQAAESSLGNVVVGVFYGLILFTKETFEYNNSTLRIRYFYSGKWNYGERRIRNFFLTLLIYVIPAAIVLVVFLVVIPIFVYNIYAEYFTMTFAWIITIIYWIRFAPQLAFRFKLIEEDTQQVAKSNSKIPQVQPYLAEDEMRRSEGPLRNEPPQKIDNQKPTSHL